MSNRTRRPQAPRGVTLIMVAAVLSILAAMATGFYTLMLMQTKSAVRYSDTVRADMMARAGVEYAVAQIREQAYRRSEDPSAPWYTTDYLHGAVRNVSFPDSPLLHDGVDDDLDGQIDNLEEARLDPAKAKPYSQVLTNSANADAATEGGSDRFVLNIYDAASRININAGDNIAVSLDNLCRAIGPPLVPANQDALLPRCWAPPGVGGAWGEVLKLFDNTQNVNDKSTSRDIYYWLYDAAGAPVWMKYGDPVNGRPKFDLVTSTGVAIYGDGYAIAGYRARNGRFGQIEEVKQALTYVERNGNVTVDDALEQLEIEVKYQALRDYITVDSWVDTTTVCVGKFEWVSDPFKSGVYEIAVDRDKSWIPDDLTGDPMNRRGSLRGCYVAIINGHGAGQVRRIRTNGVDWIQIDTFKNPQGAQEGFSIPPGPVSSYMIFPPENAKLVDASGKDIPYNYPDNPPPPGTLALPKTDNNGEFVPPLNADGSTKIDYSLRPLCIHRAPVNINTASDKVLTALFMGINVQQGHHLAVGTEADLEGTRTAWKMDDPKMLEPYLLTAQGLKRVPVVSGKLVLSRLWDAGDPTQMKPPTPDYDVRYLSNFDGLGEPGFVVQNSKSGKKCTMNEGHELAYRVIMARQRDSTPSKYIEPDTGNPTAVDISKNGAYLRGPFKNWDDFFFRVVRPWEEKRLRDGWTDVNGTGVMDGWVDLNKNQAVDPNEVDTYKIAGRARMLMAHFNPNTDLLKFEPNIEWIDRWGRNFTEMEPVHIYPNVDPLPNNTPPIHVRYGRAGWEGGNGVRHWSRADDWCPAVLMDFDSGKVGAYITRGFRYKSDEMIDKTDMNRSTTEFCFDSSGVYEIQALGQVCKRGELMAERKLQALVKVYDVWRESTQRQFVQGTIEVGPGVGSIGAPGSSHSGQVTRDAVNGAKGWDSVLRLPLATLPEPQVPLRYRIARPSRFSLGVNAEMVDVDPASKRGVPRDAFGNERKNPYDLTATSIEVPDVVANRIQPAGYDGQIVLATNTQQFDPDPDRVDSESDRDSFLASFDGDLDTGTCLGNGREQAKVPGVPGTHDGYKYRVVDTTSLLGVLNDTLWDQDPMASNVPNTYMWGVGDPMNDAVEKGSVCLNDVPLGHNTASVVGEMLRGINRNNYWENATLRQGDLRVEGARLTSPGVGGNDATLKYCIGWADADGRSHPATVNEDTLVPGNYPRGGVPPKSSSYYNRANFDLMQSFKGSQDGEGFLLTMWAKLMWRQDDNRPHEFFNNSGVGHYLSGRGFILSKGGRYNYANWNDGGGFSGCTRRKNDFYFGMEGEHTDILDRDNVVQLHGGSNRVRYASPPAHFESPAFRVQPFRWMMVGARLNYCQVLVNQPGQMGHWYRGGGLRQANLISLINFLNRPFTSTQLYPEDAVYQWNGTVATASIWPEEYYMYQCNTLINGNRFMRAPDVGRTFTMNTGKPTFIQQTGNNDWMDALDNKGNGWYGQAGRERQVDATKGADIGGRTAQDARWDWADHPESPQNTDGQVNRVKNNVKVFSINNLNLGEVMSSEGANIPDLNTKETEPSNWGECTKSAWIYRHMPEDGTYGVIDELKISKREKTMSGNNQVKSTDRVIGKGGGTAYSGKWMGGEMRTSRYYLPPDPQLTRNCPTFTSQTMLKSLKGSAFKGASSAKGEEVCVARVGWTVFTPRFLGEYKWPERAGPRYTRKEYYFEEHYGSNTTDQPASKQLQHSVAYNGPFDTLRYNDESANNDETDDDTTGAAHNKNRYFSVRRPCPADYILQPQSTRGVEVELGTVNSAGKFTAIAKGMVVEYDKFGKMSIKDAYAKTTFTDPDKINVLGEKDGTGQIDVNRPVRVYSGELCYRVRFRYPVDQLVDKAGGVADDRAGRAVNGGHSTTEGDAMSQYLLDTPVFDDISVTYFTKPRILSYREVLE